jgi:electron transport complex protein RnfC
LARERHENRLLRIERDKQEKAEKLALKEREAAAKLTAQPAIPVPTPAEPQASTDDTQQIRIYEAVERAKAQAAATHPQNTDSLTPTQIAEIAEIEARRAKIRELAADSGAEDEPPKPN